MGDMQFDEFAVMEPEAATTQPMTDEEIVDLVCTENDAQEQESEDKEEEMPPAKVIKNASEFFCHYRPTKSILKEKWPPCRTCRTTRNSRCWVADISVQQAEGGD